MMFGRKKMVVIVRDESRMSQEEFDRTLRVLEDGTDTMRALREIARQLEEEVLQNARAARTAEERSRILAELEGAREFMAQVITLRDAAVRKMAKR